MIILKGAPAAVKEPAQPGSHGKHGGLRTGYED